MADLKVVATPLAPQAIGPYSQAIIANGVVYAAGQTALDPATMSLVAGDVKVQTERVLANLAAVLEAAGSSLSRVVKTTVYLTTMDDFAAMNEVYAARFGAHRPARSTVAVRALPKNGLVEIDCIAAL
jgi:2-iminobutanoate/2-iminopropanoate deaminase